MGTGEAARLPGITVKTLQRWEREARLVPRARTASNRRRYTESQLRTFLRLAPAEPRRVVAYWRVSSAVRRPDLANQRRVPERFAVARGLAGVEFVEEVGGLNFGLRALRDGRDVVGQHHERVAVDAVDADLLSPAWRTNVASRSGARTAAPSFSGTVTNSSRMPWAAAQSSRAGPPSIRSPGRQTQVERGAGFDPRPVPARARPRRCLPAARGTTARARRRSAYAVARIGSAAP